MAGSNPNGGSIAFSQFKVGSSGNFQYACKLFPPESTTHRSWSQERSHSMPDACSRFGTTTLLNLLIFVIKKRRCLTLASHLEKEPGMKVEPQVNSQESDGIVILAGDNRRMSLARLKGNDSLSLRDWK
jgi:hypothetical protein